MSSPAHDAWLRYQSANAQRWEKFLASDLVQTPQLREQGLYFLHSLEVSAFNLYVAPRPQYPALYVQSAFMPMELSWGQPNPDFLNHLGFVDGAHNYRIYGNRRGNIWATIQIFRGFWGDDIQGTLGNVDFDDVPTAADGSFEIFLGPNPPAETGGSYWVKLDPDNHNTLMTMRETSYDWSNEAPMEVHIELLDRVPNAPIFFDEAELALRIDKASKWASACYDYAMFSAKPLGEINTFVENLAGRQQGGNPLGYWFPMVYQIKPDEALIIEMQVVEARYWGVQLSTIWSQTTDYSYHQSSLNNVQAVIDPDGYFRAVLALDDPGVPNWLNPAGLPDGVALLRFYKAEKVVTPNVTKVAVADIRRHLPPDTPSITPEARQVVLDARRSASLRRYGQ